jgi:hypothetical protein
MTTASLRAAWIDRQPWPDAVKAEAHAIEADRKQAGLHPLTGSAWVVFAHEHGVPVRLVERP